MKYLLILSFLLLSCATTQSPQVKTENECYSEAVVLIKDLLTREGCTLNIGSDAASLPNGQKITVSAFVCNPRNNLLLFAINEKDQLSKDMLSVGFKALKLFECTTSRGTEALYYAPVPVETKELNGPI